MEHLKTNSDIGNKRTVAIQTS
jgi:hypothetical protein